MNFSERIKKCFSVGYSQSVGLQDTIDKLLSLTKVDVRLENETDHSVEYGIYKIGGPKIISVLFNTDSNGTMTVTEIDLDGSRLPSISAVDNSFTELFSKLQDIIDRRLNS